MTTGSKLKKWLSGSFVCRRCHQELTTQTLGFGTCICPNCYQGEPRFLFPDQTYWLNRLLETFLVKGIHAKCPDRPLTSSPRLIKPYEHTQPVEIVHTSHLAGSVAETPVTEESGKTQENEE